MSYITSNSILTSCPDATISTSGITTNTITINGNTTSTGTIVYPTVNTATATVPFISYAEPGGVSMNKEKAEKTEIKKEENIMHDPSSIKQIIQYVPQKVYGFIFHDGEKIKTIRSNEDVFNFEYACFLAIAKKIYGKSLTFEGVLNKSYQLMYEKYYIKMVKKAIKDFEKKQKEEAKKEEAEEVKKRQKKKKAEKKKRQNERKRQYQINIIKQAIKESKGEV